MSHLGHVEVCPHCGQEEKVHNRNVRWVAPNGIVGAVTAYTLGRLEIGKYVDGDWVTKKEFRRTTTHRLACAKKRGIPPYES